MSTQLTVTQTAVQNIRSIVESDGYKKRFESMLGKRAPQFIASISNIVAQSEQLAKCEPRSVILAAVMAATLDLPIEKSLGYAYVVPFGTTATFTIGYKGLIQLALRSGQYASMRDAAVNAEAFRGYDDVGEPIIDWKALDETKDPVGYVFAWRTVNGFRKAVYWSRDKCLAHGKKFSKTFGMNSSTWKTNTDAMCLKTVIRSALSKYGLLSIEMQHAMANDSVEMVDDGAGNLIPKGGALDLTEGDPEPEDKRTMAEKLADKKAEKKVEEASKTAGAAEPQKQDTKTEAPPAEAQTTETTEPEVDRETLIARMQDSLLDRGITERKLFDYAKQIGGMVHEGAASVWEIPTASLAKLEKAIPALVVKKG